MLGGLVFIHAAALVLLPTAAGAGIVATGLWHSGRLYQDWRPRCLPPCWAMAGFTSYCSAVMTIWLPSSARADVRDAAGCCTRRATGASRAACVGRLRPEYGWRLSFCCAREDCRKRATPASLRFLGRKVYLGAVVVLISALRGGPTPARMRYLEEQVGISRRTLMRWRRWWCEELLDTPFWRAASAGLMPPLRQVELPASLLERFAGAARDRLVSLLRFIAPITTRSATVHAT